MPTRTILTGAAIVLADRVIHGRSLVIEGDSITDIVDGWVHAGDAEIEVALDGRILVPGFIDLHVHGVAGVDVLDGPGSIGRVAATLPRYGVTAFSPTSLACPPEVLARMLEDVQHLMAAPPDGRARVLPAHLESNFLNPEFRGAQPLEMLRTPDRSGPGFSGFDILEVIDRIHRAVGIVTLAPEQPGGLALVRRFVEAGMLVSLGHSGATFDEASDAFQAGASRATHLFSAMSQMLPREPGLVGAVLSHEHVHAELICDGVHALPSVMRVAIAAKTPARIVAISDGTAASGLPAGTRTHLGDLAITARDVARLDSGAMAGSVLTMSGAFATLVQRCHCDLVAASRMCSGTPADDIRLGSTGRIAVGARADLVVLDDDLQVEQTWVAGRRVWPAAGADRRQA